MESNSIAVLDALTGAELGLTPIDHWFDNALIDHRRACAALEVETMMKLMEINPIQCVWCDRQAVYDCGLCQDCNDYAYQCEVAANAELCPICNIRTADVNLGECMACFYDCRPEDDLSFAWGGGDDDWTDAELLRAQRSSEAAVTIGFDPEYHLSQAEWEKQQEEIPF